MMTKYHNSYRRRVAVTLLAALCIFGLWTSPILADPDDPACHCEIDFTGPADICVGETVPFTGTAIGVGMDCVVSSWTWDFGDPASGPANTGYGQVTQHTYNTAGVYTVTLTAVEANGTQVVTKVDYIIVHPGPTADFRAHPMSGFPPLVVSFTDLSISDVGLDSLRWDFGGGVTSDVQHPMHTFTASGTYPVTLTVWDRCGEDTHEDTIRVPEPCVIDFDHEGLCVNQPFYFFGSATASCDVISWSWSFGDGGTGSGQNPSHVYNTAGTYDVTLTAVTSGGPQVVTHPVTVQPGPTADFEAVPPVGQAPLDVAFSNLTVSVMGLDSLLWAYGDGTTSQVDPPTHTYTSPGTYYVKLTVWDVCGEDTHEDTIRVLEPCVIDFTHDGLCVNQPFYFFGSATASCDVISWSWEFGDGGAGSGQNPVHIYNTAGPYDVTLTAVTSSGPQVVTHTVTVEPGPTADFTASPTSGLAPLEVTFTNQSTTVFLSLDSLRWDFDDGTTSQLENPTHIFTAADTYTVTLTVWDSCGSASKSREIGVSVVELTKDVDKPIARPGDELLYSVTLHNNGPDPLLDVVVVDTIPDSTALIAGSITGGGVHDAGGNLVRWNLAPVSANAQVTLEFRVVLDGPFSDVVPTVVSNQAFATIVIEGTAALATTTIASNIVQTLIDVPVNTLSPEKTVSLRLAAPNDELTYTISVYNPGPLQANDVVIYDAVPDSTSYIDGSATDGGVHNPANDSLTWNLGVLAAGSSRSVSFRVTIDSNCVDGQLIPNDALVRSSNLGGEQSRTVFTVIRLEPLYVTKKVNRPSAMIGDLVKYTVTVENYSGVLFEDVVLFDTMPAGIFCVDGTSLLNGSPTNDPTGDRSLQWALDSLPADDILTLEYTALIGASAHPGINENVVRATATQGGVGTGSNRALAQIYVLSQTLSGAIRGRVMVDCDGDGVADIDSLPPGVVGTNVYLDEGSQSRVNEKGMFFFSTVRPGERVVALDERNLEDFVVPEGAQASVFVHVHETGESYVIFRICPDYPRLDIQKRASIVPTVKVTKRAILDPEQPRDSLGVKVDYEIDIKSNGLADPTQVRVVDSLPVNTHLILAQSQELAPIRSGDRLVYEVTAAQERFKKSVSYSLRELTPGVRKFLTNRVYLEGDLMPRGTATHPVVSEPIEVSSGPFLLVPPQDVVITLTPALFITSMAYLQPPAIPELHAAADSILKYADAEVKVEGHTDLRPIHTQRFPSNWELGEARAKSVVNWLVENRGIDADRLSYESFAATRPVVTDVPITSIDLQPNRRTEVHIKTRVGGVLAPGVQPGDQWENSTSLALDPVRFDTLFEAVQTPVDVDFGDSWEVLLSIENGSAIGADDVVLTDVLPDGSEYLGNSAVVDGRSIAAQVTGQTISFNLERIEPSQKLELRYRIRALEGRTPSGGGAASVAVKSSTDLPVIQKSNEVRFK